MERNADRPSHAPRAGVVGSSEVGRYAVSLETVWVVRVWSVELVEVRL